MASYKQKYGDCDKCPVASICKSVHANSKVICENADNQTPEELEEEYQNYLEASVGDWQG